MTKQQLYCYLKQQKEKKIKEKLKRYINGNIRNI